MVGVLRFRARSGVGPGNARGVSSGLEQRRHHECGKEHQSRARRALRALQDRDRAGKRARRRTGCGSTPHYAAPQLFWSDVGKALGQAIVMTPLSAIAMVGITPAEAGAASGLFNMMRNLGGTIGTAAIETFFTKREQFHSAIINPHVSLLEPATRSRLADLQQYFMSHGFPDPAGALHRAVIAVGDIIRAQATIMGYADCFALLGVLLIATILPVALLKRGTASASGAH